jgi:hypothetical protein
MATTKETGNAEATVKDYSNGKNGSAEVTVPYTFEYEVIATKEDLDARFALAQLIDLANARLKSTANSGARQKAIAPYAQDPNSPAAIRESMIKDAMKLGKSKEQATAFVDSLMAS